MYLLVFIGAAAIGGPLLGLIDQHTSPRAGRANGQAPTRHRNRPDRGQARQQQVTPAASLTSL